MSTEQWNQVSHVLDYIMAQPTGKPTKESSASYGIRGEPEQPKRKPKTEKPKEQQAEQLRLF